MLANLGPWADLLLAAVAAGIVVVGVLLARGGARGRRVAGGLALLSAVAVLALTLAPESGATERESFCFDQVDGTLFLDAANTAMLFPTAFFGAIATRAPLPVLAAASGLSALIELVQATAVVLNRSCDVGDWLTNTVGAVLGVLLAAAVLLAVHRLDRGRTAGAAVEERVEEARR